MQVFSLHAQHRLCRRPPIHAAVVTVVTAIELHGLKYVSSLPEGVITREDGGRRKELCQSNSHSHSHMLYSHTALPCRWMWPWLAPARSLVHQRGCSAWGACSPLSSRPSEEVKAPPILPSITGFPVRRRTSPQRDYGAITARRAHQGHIFQTFCADIFFLHFFRTWFGPGFAHFSCVARGRWAEANKFEATH